MISYIESPLIKDEFLLGQFLSPLAFIFYFQLSSCCSIKSGTALLYDINCLSDILFFFDYIS